MAAYGITVPLQKALFDTTMWNRREKGNQGRRESTKSGRERQFQFPAVNPAVRPCNGLDAIAMPPYSRVPILVRRFQQRQTLH